jgi:hypothetical protein
VEAAAQAGGAAAASVAVPREPRARWVAVAAAAEAVAAAGSEAAKDAATEAASLAAATRRWSG